MTTIFESNSHAANVNKRAVLHFSHQSREYSVDVITVHNGGPHCSSLPPPNSSESLRLTGPRPPLCSPEEKAIFSGTEKKSRKPNVEQSLSESSGKGSTVQSAELDQVWPSLNKSDQAWPSLGNSTDYINSSHKPPRSPLPPRLPTVPHVSKTWNHPQTLLNC